MSQSLACDAADVAITPSFGSAYLCHFYIDSFEVDENGAKLPIEGLLPTPVTP